MKELKRIWDDRYRVGWNEADINNQASLVTISNWLQETAGRHAQHLGFGFDKATRENLIWVVVRLLIKMDRYPAWKDEITVRTWPRGLDGLFAMRDFLILDKDQQRIGGASSQWFVLDAETRKPRPAEIVRDTIPLILPDRATDEEPEKIMLPGDLHGISSVKASFTELDMHGHVNNSRFVEWILNVFPVEVHRDHLLHSFMIEFLSEVRLGEEIRIYSNSGLHPSLLRGVRKPDDRTLFRARLEWVKRQFMVK
jgi:medium-chain acyl-[acyl-carrier-protein] hydrolase